MAVWMVRAGKHGQGENLALHENVVVVEYDKIKEDLSRLNSLDETKQLYSRYSPDAGARKVALQAGQLWTFVKRIEQGDIVILPFKTRSAIALGEVTGPYRYRTDEAFLGRHTRPVKWIRTDVPRADFGQDLLSSFGTQLTVFQVRRSNVEGRILSILKGGKDPCLDGQGIPPGTSGPDPVDGEQDWEPALDLERIALDGIRARIQESFQRHELTRLVAELLRAQGYHTHVSPPGPDGGVDILAGQGPMGFDHPRLCVQVKSGGTPEGVNTLRELQGVMKTFGAHQGLLVSWSGFRESVYRESRTLFFDIRLWDSDDLIEGLLQHYDRMSDEIQAELPLRRIWMLVEEE